MLPYNPCWPQSFAEERDRIEPVLSPWLVGPIEHIGSTSIAGMPAKAIIDMVAVIGVIEDALGAIDPLSVLGWLQAPEPTDDENRRRSFCTPSIAHRTHHLHVVEEASDLWRGLLAFRDYLRTHPGLASAYAALKRELATMHGSDPNRREPYRRGKSSYIQEVTELGLADGWR
jgi:GrpB-like predicted nucleotidyltransferase (UPF0157 family)